MREIEETGGECGCIYPGKSLRQSGFQPFRFHRLLPKSVCRGPYLSDRPVLIIGAGPAGLTAAYLLAKAGRRAVIFEADPRHVGGIARTIDYKGFLFDIGGHRFFSKSAKVEALWTELLPNDLLECSRSSRIYYRGKFFDYPLRAFEALFKLGLLESLLCIGSYAKAKLRPVRNPETFEDWVGNQFGKRLFNIFFKSYTEKVWGMSCTEISADWAAQRIKGLSLMSAARNALRRKNRRKPEAAVTKTLIESFRYPRKGPGMLWEACAEKFKAMGGRLELGTRVTRLERTESGFWRVTAEQGGGVMTLEAEQVISSAPIRELVAAISPPVPEPAAQAARSLRYRDFLIVVLVLEDRNLFSDNWIYIHDPSVRVGRIQNFKSWSPEMVPDPRYCAYGMEYFCNEGDPTWIKNDAELIDFAKAELEKLGLAKPGEVLDGKVVRQKKAYPVYDHDYRDHVANVREDLERTCPGLHLVGRNGLHRYDNQDHAMMTAMLCVENIMAGRRKYDVWRVNEDAEYHESGSSGLRFCPTQVERERGQAA